MISKIKKIIGIFLCTAFCAAIFAGYSANTEANENAENSEEPSAPMESAAVVIEEDTVVIEEGAVESEEVQDALDEGLPKVYMTIDISPKDFWLCTKLWNGLPRVRRRLKCRQESLLQAII